MEILHFERPSQERSAISLHFNSGVSAGAGKKTEPLGKVRSELEFTVSISIFPPGLEFTISIFWQTQREYFNLTDSAKKEYFNKAV